MSRIVPCGGISSSHYSVHWVAGGATGAESAGSVLVVPHGHCGGEFRLWMGDTPPMAMQRSVAEMPNVARARVLNKASHDQPPDKSPAQSRGGHWLPLSSLQCCTGGLLLFRGFPSRSEPVRLGRRSFVFPKHLRPGLAHVFRLFPLLRHSTSLLANTTRCAPIIHPHTASILPVVPIVPVEALPYPRLALPPRRVVSLIASSFAKLQRQSTSIGHHAPPNHDQRQRGNLHDRRETA